MNRQQRIKLIEYQNRAFIEGNVEFINGQWIFFDHETDEASALDDFLHNDIEIFRLTRWKKGKLLEPGKLSCIDGSVYFKDQDKIRIRKHLVFSLEKLLDDLNDDAFYQFVTTLNGMQFSIYDCIYCYNHLTFVDSDSRKSGVNFIVFDNQEQICNVQHHFCYFEKVSDRFEFTLNTGKRMIIEKLA